MTGGGSGGHIAPLIPLAHALKRRQAQCRIIYVGLAGDKLEGLKSRFGIFDEVHFVTAGKFRRYHGQNFLARLIDFKTNLLNARDFFKVIKGLYQARRLLKKIKPDVVFSKGGYVVVPVGLAAARLGVPIITHDSDALPGLANRLVGRRAYLHTTGMPANDYNQLYPAETVKYVGVPVDERLKTVTPQIQIQYKKRLGMPADGFVLLVSGGGLGSKTLNDKIITIAKDLLNDPKFYILHFCGEMHQPAVKDGYRRSLDEDQLKRVKLVPFSDEFYVFSGAADLVIARAGASTLAELALQQKACIILPAAFLTGGHQSKNAEILRQHDAVITKTDNIEPQKLLGLIKDLQLNPKRRAELAHNLSSLAKPQAAEELAELILAP